MQFLKGPLNVFILFYADRLASSNLAKPPLRARNIPENSRGEWLLQKTLALEEAEMRAWELRVPHYEGMDRREIASMSGLCATS